MSLGPGSSMSGCVWATSRISRLPAMAWSNAATDRSRPTNSGITVCGYTTTSRSGKIGNRRTGWISVLSVIDSLLAVQASGFGLSAANDAEWGSAHRAARKADDRWMKNARLATFVSHGRGLVRLVDDVRLGLAGHDGVVHDDFGRIRHRRQVVHGVEQHVLEDRAEAASPGLALHGFTRHRAQCVLAEFELD